MPCTQALLFAIQGYFYTCLPYYLGHSMHLHIIHILSFESCHGVKILIHVYNALLKLAYGYNLCTVHCIKELWCWMWWPHHLLRQHLQTNQIQAFSSCIQINKSVSNVLSRIICIENIMKIAAVSALWHNTLL